MILVIIKFICKSNYMNILISKENLTELVLRKIIEYNGKGSYIYGLTGSSIFYTDLIFQDAIKRGDIKYVTVSHESCGSYISQYEGEVNNKVGINFTTSGPAITTAIQGIYNAFCEDKPLICFHGDTVSGGIDYINPEIMKSVTKKYYTIDTNTINPESIIDEAFYIAINGTSSNPHYGPVSIFVKFDAWLSPYKYTEKKPIVPKNIYTPVEQLLNKIYSSISSSSKVILRVGSRAYTPYVKQLAKLTNQYKNFYLQMTFNGQNTINTYDYTNAGMEGPLSNPVVNNNYSEVDVVLNIGLGIEASEFEYIDVASLCKPRTIQWYIFNGTYVNPPPSSNSYNSIYTDVNIFIEKFVEDVYKRYPKPNKDGIWAVRNIEKYSYDHYAIDYYIKQRDQYYGTKNLTTASIIGQVAKVIYSLQTNKQYYKKVRKLVIDDNNLYAYDVSLGAFIGYSIIHHVKPLHQLVFAQAAAIGSSVPSMAGRMTTGKYKNGICFVGDGGFLNAPGFLTNLTNVLNNEFNKKTRILFVMINDNKYSNVAVEGELPLFGKFTELTSTCKLQKNIDIFEIIKTFMGNKYIKSLKIQDIKEPSEKLAEFVKGWYSKSEGYTEPGFYFIYFETATGQPYSIKN